MAQTKLPPFEERTEEELLIAQTKFIQISKNHLVISNNLRFLFWITVIGLVIGLLFIKPVLKHN